LILTERSATTRNNTRAHIVRADVRERDLNREPEDRHLDPRVMPLDLWRQREPNRRVDMPLKAVLSR
jgi:hypothetical protein